MIQPKRARAKKSRKVLAIDVGGSHVKLKLSTRAQKRRFVSGPTLTAKDMVANVLERTRDWDYDAVSIGYPGPVLHNKPVAEPHNLGKGWVGFDFRSAFNRPIKLVNDAVMQAVGSYQGGRMLFLGLGTGLGSALIVDGVIEPMELAHLPFKHATFEDYVGVRALKRKGRKKWSKAVVTVVAHLKSALEPDYVVLGGGNAKKLQGLPPNTRIGSNENAFKGAFRLWDKAGRFRL